MSAPSATDIITAMLHAVDRVDWTAIRAAFADRVTVDYSSLSGEAAATIAADELIAGWRELLPGFDATQHVTGPVVVTGDTHLAHAHTHVRAYHWLGADEWMVAGHYDFTLVCNGGSWLIAGLTLTVFHQTGARTLPNAARARAATAPRVCERP